MRGRRPNRIKNFKCFLGFASSINCVMTDSFLLNSQIVDQIDSWANCFFKVYRRRYSRDEVILKALDCIRYVEIRVGEEYTRSERVRKHTTGETLAPFDETVARELMIIPDRLYYIKDTATILGISTYFLDKYEKQGKISPTKLGGNRKVYKGSEIIRLLKDITLKGSAVSYSKLCRVKPI